MKISEIQKHAEELCNRNKWHERDVSQRFLYLMSEIGELSNELIKLKWKDQDINELKRQRIQLEMQIGSILESHAKMLEITKDENKAQDETDTNLKFLNHG